MRKVKQFWVSTGKHSGFNVDVEIVGQSRTGDDLVVRPVAGNGSFIVNKHSLKDTYKN